MNLSIKENTLESPIYFHRDYEKDFGSKKQKETTKVDSSWTGIAQRTTFASLPFFSLYKPFGFPLAMAMGSIRVLSSTSELCNAVQRGDTAEISGQVLQTAIAVGALAGTILAHPLGMLITTGQDTLIDAGYLIHALSEGNYKAASERTLSLVNNALYLGLFFAGSLELSIASLGVQVILGLYHSSEDFKNDRWIEGTAHLIMGGIRTNQMVGQIQLLQQKNEFEKKMKAFIKQIKASEKKLREEITREGSINHLDIPLMMSTGILEHVNNKAPSLTKMSAIHKTGDNTAVNAQSNNSKTELKANITRHAEVKTVANQITPPELLEVFIRYGHNSEGIPALHYASLVGDENAVSMLLNHGANPNALSRQVIPVDALGRYIDLQMLADRPPLTPLEFAARAGHLNVMKILVDRGAQVNFEEDHFSGAIKWSPALHLVAKYNHGEAVRFLLSKGAMLELEGLKGFETYNLSGFSALQIATKNGSTKALDALFEGGGININKQLYQTNGLLYCAAQNDQIGSIDWLLKHGVDINQEINGLTPLIFAIQNNNKLTTIEFLLKNKANPNIGDALLPILGRHTSIFEKVKLLVDYGADINKKDRQGETLFNKIITYKCLSTADKNMDKDALMTAELLLKENYNINQKDAQNRSILLLVKNEHDAIVKYNNEAALEKAKKIENLKKLMDWLVARGAVL
jgi:ankyrin repeat protein